MKKENESKWREKFSYLFKTRIKNNIALVVMIIILIAVVVLLFRSFCKDCSPVGEPRQKTSAVLNSERIEHTLVLSGALAAQDMEMPKNIEIIDITEEKSTEAVFSEKCYTGYAQIFCAVYDDADETANVIGSLYYGMPATITESDAHQFWQIDYDGETGFVKKEYITLHKPPDILNLFNTFIRTDLPTGEQTPAAYIDNFPILLQNPELPSGCEVTSLAMVLNYRGFEVTNRYLADNCLPVGKRGDNIFHQFIGSVYDNSSYGCYANALSGCAAAFSADYRIANISGAELEELCGYVASGYPVIVWATESMKESGAGDLWVCDDIPMGYLKNEHCLVMIGYDKINDVVVLADPLEGEKQYSLSTFYQRYCSQYMQAVLLY